MARVHRILKLVDDLYYEVNEKSWFLEAVLAYCDAVVRLKVSPPKLIPEDLKDSEIISELKITYTLIIDSGKFTVGPFEGEEEYSRVVEDVFSKFRDEDWYKIRKGVGMNHIEAKMMEFVRKLYPEPFELLDEFFDEHGSFMDEEILCFEKEIQFYIVYLDFMNQLKKKGLKFCYPTFVGFDESEIIRDVFDVLLASDSSPTTKVVCNDIFFNAGEKAIIVTGLNQGGKTTFARTYGMVHYLASLGLPIPPSKAQMYLPDGIYSKNIFMIMGANRGGKTTFLRSVAQAQITMQAGMFVTANVFVAPIHSGVFSHFKREEDKELKKRKVRRRAVPSG